MAKEEIFPKLGQFYKVNRRKVKLIRRVVKVNCSVFSSENKRTYEFIFENKKGREVRITSTKYIKEWI